MYAFVKILFAIGLVALLLLAIADGESRNVLFWIATTAWGIDVLIYAIVLIYLK